MNRTGVLTLCLSSRAVRGRLVRNGKTWAEEMLGERGWEGHLRQKSDSRQEKREDRHSNHE